VEFISNNNDVTLLHIFDYNCNHNNPKKLKKNKYTEKFGSSRVGKIVARSKIVLKQAGVVHDIRYNSFN